MKSLIKKIAKSVHRTIASSETIVIGDSHTRVFEHWYFMLAFPKRYFNVCAVDGATASGLENPNSKTQAYEKFNSALRNSHYNKIILILGEVDTGFVIWYRAMKYQSSVSDMCEQAVKRYCAFLSDIKENGEVIVISCPLPTIKDKDDMGDIANLRSAIDVSQNKRTTLALSFNQSVERFCLNTGIKFINLDDVSLGSNGLVKHKLMNTDTANHHYSKLPYAKLIARELKDIM